MAARICALFALTSLLPGALAAHPGAAGESPRILSREFLLGNADLEAPVAMQEFAPGEGVSSAIPTFSGMLSLVDSTAHGFETVIDLWDRRGSIGPELSVLPAIDFEFVQHNAHLIPTRRGPLRSEHPYWEVIVQPGLVWREAGDGRWWRAALPVALQERSANCIHNGVMTWLFNDAGEVSRVVYQFSSETCGYLKFNLWGATSADFRPRRPENAAQIIARFERNRQSRLPVAPLTGLQLAYQGVDAQGLAVNDGIRRDDLSVFGIVADGTNYRSDCATRHGPYPFCDELPLPSYSTAKSIVAAIAAMRLEHMMPGVLDRSIASLVEDCSAAQWRDVSMAHALDMATGNYDSTADEADEHAEPSRAFIFSDSHTAKLSFACGHYERKSRPGTRFVYHTSDTYLVGAALQAQLRKSYGAGADIYDLLLRPIWQRLGLSPLMDQTLRTYDAWRQPFTGYGLTYELDDVLRIGAWLRAGATIDGEPVLDPGMLRASLQGDPDDRGLAAGADDLRYNNGFWAYDSGPSLGCDDAVWTPFMSGVSGITVVLFPNDVIYYYFSDSYVFSWQSGRELAHAIRKLC